MKIIIFLLCCTNKKTYAYEEPKLQSVLAAPIGTSLQAAKKIGVQKAHPSPAEHL